MLTHFPTDLTGQVLLCASVVEAITLDAATIHGSRYQSFRDLRNRAAYDPGNITLELVRRALNSTETVSFQTIFGRVYNRRMQNLKSTLHAHREYVNHAFESARDGGWEVQVWTENVENKNATLESVNPRHVYQILKTTLETNLRGLNFQLLPNIFTQECDIPSQAKPELFGAWAKNPKAEEEKEAAEETAQPGEETAEGPPKEVVAGTGKEMEKEDKLSKWAKRKAARKVKEKAQKEAAREKEEEQIWAEAQRMKKA